MALLHMTNFDHQQSSVLQLAQRVDTVADNGRQVVYSDFVLRHSHPTHTVSSSCGHQ